MITPGPWYLVAEDGIDFTAISTLSRLPRGESLSLDQEVLGASDWLRAKPEDLRLMAAAPEMLELLKRFPEDSSYSLAVKVVIAKAEGK